MDPALEAAPAPPSAGTAVLGTRRKVLLSAAAIGVSATLAVTGTLASFSASVSRGHTLTTGVPTLVLGATGAATNRLGIDATGLAPGNVVYRAFDITNSGTVPFTSYTLSSTATTSSLLDTDLTRGLQARVERCSLPWAESGTSPSFTYTCPGTRTDMVASRPVIMVSVPLAGMSSAAPDGTDHLLLSETLPTGADNSFQNQMTAVTFTFNAG